MKTGYWSNMQMNLLAAVLVNDTQRLLPHAQDNKKAILAKWREIKLTTDPFYTPSHYTVKY